MEDLQGISIFLIGMMGSGKTTLGQVLSKRLNYRFFDTDVLIERVTGRSIGDIFASSGEGSFRELETRVLEQLSSYTRSVIATGGGIVIEPMNWSYLRHGLIVWLDVPVEGLVKRLKSDNTRPLLLEGELEGRLTELSDRREHLYREADLRISIGSDESTESIADRIINAIPSVIKSTGLDRD